MAAEQEQDIQIHQRVQEPAVRSEHMLITVFEVVPVVEEAAQKDNGAAKVNRITVQHHS
jgi:hypothetical protein